MAPKSKTNQRTGSKVQSTLRERKRRRKTMDASVEGVVIFVRALVEMEKSKDFIDMCSARKLRIRVPMEIVDLARGLLGADATTVATPEAVGLDHTRKFTTAARSISSARDDFCES